MSDPMKDTKKKENKVDEETALQWFEDWCEAMDIDIDEKDMDEDDLNDFYKHRKKLVTAIVRGDLEFNDAGEAKYTPSRPNSKFKEPITFKERTGASIMTMDGKKKGHDVRKMYAVMADMTGKETKVFANLVGTDIKICETIFMLLMV